MKGFRVFTTSLIFALILTAAAFAQAKIAQTVPAGKIVYVNSEAFYDNAAGITQLVEIFEKLEAEFQPQADELDALFRKIKSLEEEIRRFINYKPPPGAYKTIEDIIAEYESILEKYKTKETVARYQYERRAAETIDVVKKKIARFANSFAAEKGYVLILDISKSNGTFTFSSFDNADVTAEFIKYCNENFAKTKTPVRVTPSGVIGASSYAETASFYRALPIMTRFHA